MYTIDRIGMSFFISIGSPPKKASEYKVIVLQLKFDSRHLKFNLDYSARSYISKVCSTSAEAQSYLNPSSFDPKYRIEEVI